MLITMNEHPPVRWLLLTASLTGRAASTARVRLWRALKDLGVGNLRDGVSLLPATAETRAAFEVLAQEVEAEGGTAWLLALPAQAPPVDDALIGLFDRSADYAELLQTLTRLGAELPRWDEATARRELRQAAKALADIERIDFFPGAAREQARAAFAGLEAEVNRRFSPQEPSPGTGELRRLDAAAFQRQLWATRRHLWVDRVASAWLIRRFIDPEARFIWLDAPADGPADALGFDFDGAAFSHVGDRVTFEVLLASFGLDADAGLARLGQLVHYLDAGGLPVAEAAGFEAVLAGLRDAAPDDDALLATATPLLDALYRTYSGARA
jgi:hypothetical protein